MTRLVSTAVAVASALAGLLLVGCGDAYSTGTPSRADGHVGARLTVTDDSTNRVRCWSRANWGYTLSCIPWSQLSPEGAPDAGPR